jgi:hypothetical protein
MKGQDKQKKGTKKPAQRSLKEKRQEKRAAKASIPRSEESIAAPCVVTTDEPVPVSHRGFQPCSA